MQLLADRGVKEVGVDDYGDVHASIPGGRRVRIRRYPRRFGAAYWGISLGVWINVVVVEGHRGMWTIIGMLVGQLLVHEAWPRKVERRRKPIGDSAAEQIHRVL